MRAPQYEQADMLSVCIWRAAEELQRLELKTFIDRVEVAADKVHIWSGSTHLILVARDEGSEMPGGCRWVAHLVDS
jgi:hypothetical protein